MKRFFLVSLLIAILSAGVFFVATPYFDKTKKVYHLYSAYEQYNLNEKGYNEYVKISGKPKATIWAFGVFAVLMTANILYELYIMPKKKKNQSGVWIEQIWLLG